MKLLWNWIFLVVGIQPSVAFVLPAKTALWLPHQHHFGRIVLATERNVNGNDMTAATNEKNLPVQISNQNAGYKNSNNIRAPNNEWRSPNSLWSRRDTGLAAVASLLSGPLLLQREAMLPIAATNPMTTNAARTAVATAAVEAGDALIRNIWLGRLVYPTLIVALEMGLFEALKDRPLSLDQLGRRLQPKLYGTSSRALEAVTSVLLSLGLVQWSDQPRNKISTDVENGVTSTNPTTETRPFRLELTESARAVLLKDSPYFWGAQLFAADGMTSTLRRRIQLESQSAAAGVSGIVAYESHSDQVIDSFIDSMQSHSAVTAEATAKALESVLSKSNDGSCHVLDMAGGSGCFALAIAKRYTTIKVTLADLPNVVASWRRRHYGATVSVVQRIEAVSANLFDASTWPSDCQVVLLANVLHDWGEAQVIDILSNARAALISSPISKEKMVVIIEQLINQERTGPLPAALASISMLMGDWRTGKQYSLSELIKVAQIAGFHRVELGPPCGSFHHAVICHLN